MGTLPRVGVARSRARVRAGGAARIAVLALLLLALGAGAWLRTGGPVAPEAHAPPPAGQPAADALAVEAPQADEDGPALARAAEAGLHRMRVPFSRPAPETAPAGDERGAARRSAAAATAPAPTAATALAGTATPSAPTGPGLAGEPIEVRDLRDPRAQREAARPPPREPPPERRLTLPPPQRLLQLPPAEGSVTVIGESTLLIRSHGLTVLTDPGFLRRGERARLGWAMSAARRADPAIDLEALPPVDVVVLSRLREDRFDRVTRRRLPRDVAIVAPAEARAELVSMGFASVHALPRWGSLRITRGDARLTLTATPTRVGPSLRSALLPASMGTLLDFGTDDPTERVGAGYRIWISGDAALDEALLAELEPRLAGVDLALMHVGDASPLAFGGAMDAGSALAAARRLGARTTIPLPLGDYAGRPGPALAATGQGTAADGSSATRVRVLERGDVHRFAPVQHWALADDETRGVR